MAKKKVQAEVPPNCASCDERPADGSLFITFNAFAQKHREPFSNAKPPMDRGWSLHLPICAVCVRKSVAVNVKLDVREGSRAYGHLDPEKK